MSQPVYDYGTGDGNFKRGAAKPAIIMVGLLLVIGAVVLVIFAIKGEGEKLGKDEMAKQKKELALKPRDEQLPKWREWAARDDVPDMQQEAFAQLAWVKDDAGLALIIKGLAHHDHRVRGTAASALLEYGSPKADGAKPALLKAMAEADSSDKPQIAWALATLKESSAFEAVLGEYRLGHLAKVQRLDGNPAFDPELMAGMVTLDKLASFAGDESESVRQLCATILSRTGDAKWTDVLIKLVKDKSVEVAREAAVGLGKIANEKSMAPLLEALTKADKDSRQKFLEALRDGVGAKGLVLALKSVQKGAGYEREKFQTKVIFDMLRDLQDPRGGDYLVEYINTNPRPHWKTEAAMRLAEVGDLRAATTLGWRMKQDPLKIYNAAEDPEYRQDDNERVVGARYLADLAILNPDKRGELLAAAEEPVMFWITDKPQPHANGMRFLAAAGSKEFLPKIRKWADPTEPLPKEGAQPPMPMNWETAQSALRYLGWTQDPQGWPILEKQINRRPPKLEITMEVLQQGGLAVIGMTLRGIAYGSADGFAQWGDSKAFPTLVKHVEDTANNGDSRLEACFALAWVATDDQMKEIVAKVKAPVKPNDAKGEQLRACYLESLIRKPVPAATAALVDLIDEKVDLQVRHQAARAIAFGGMSKPVIDALMEKLKNNETRTDAALAILIGGDTDSAMRTLATFNDAGPEAMEELKTVYNQTFGYWSDRNYENGDVARWIENANACRHVKVRDSLQDWPALLLSRSIQGIDFDNGPHSITRVQFRIRLYRDAKGADEKKRTQAIQILKFMKEKGVLMALRSEQGPWQEQARQAFFEVMNPKLTGEKLPDAPEAKGGGANVIAPKK